MATTPSSRRHVAPTGQTWVHGGFSHCMHGRGRKRRRTFGYVPTSSFTTGRYTTPGGSWFSALQAIVQASQPLHFRRSITITHRRSPTGLRIAATSSRCMRRRSLSPSVAGGRVGRGFGADGDGLVEADASVCARAAPGTRYATAATAPVVRRKSILQGPPLPPLPGGPEGPPRPAR